MSVENKEWTCEIQKKNSVKRDEDQFVFCRLKSKWSYKENRLLFRWPTGLPKKDSKTNFTNVRCDKLSIRKLKLLKISAAAIFLVCTWSFRQKIKLPPPPYHVKYSRSKYILQFGLGMPPENLMARHRPARAAKIDEKSAHCMLCNLIWFRLDWRSIPGFLPISEKQDSRCDKLNRKQRQTRRTQFLSIDWLTWLESQSAFWLNKWFIDWLIDWLINEVLFSVFFRINKVNECRLRH